MASSEAIAFCDVDNFSGPEIECDASTLTEDEWQKRRAHTIGGSDCAAIFGENKYKTNLDVYYEKSESSRYSHRRKRRNPGSTSSGDISRRNISNSG